MITRKQYLDDSMRPNAHRDYYAQFVSDDVRALVTLSIGVEALRASTDRAFNDIPLRRWDALVSSLPRRCAELLREAGDYLTLGGGVCILKEAARQIRDGEP